MKRTVIMSVLFTAATVGLAFAQGESTVLFRRVYLQRFMGELEELLRPEFVARGITFNVNINYRGTARVDEGKLRRLVHNIARNALEALPPRGGAFSITVDRANDDLLLTFSDTGPGVPEEILPRREVSTSSSSYGGSSDSGGGGDSFSGGGGGESGGGGASSSD